MVLNKDWFIENRASFADDLTQEQIKDKSHYFIFKYDFINKICNTEHGFKPANDTREKYYQFTEIVKGNESIFLAPHACYIINHHDEFNHSYLDVKVKKDPSFFYKGYKIDESGGQTFNTSNFGGYGDFATISDSEQINFKILHKVTKADLTCFYFIPDPLQNPNDKTKGYDDNDIYYISSYTNYYDVNNKYVCSDITFENIQFNLVASGMSTYQHIYLSSPGQGYLIPKLQLDNNKIPTGWDWNYKYTQDRGIKTIQIQVTGNYAFAALEVWGIPVSKNHNNLNDQRWYAPRKLLVQNLRLPMNEDFVKVSTNENTPVYVNVDLQAIADYPSYAAMRKDLVGDKELTYQGIVESDYVASMSTNSDGKAIQDYTLAVGDTFLATINNYKTDGNANPTSSSFYVSPSAWFHRTKNMNVNEELGLRNIDLTNLYDAIQGTSPKVHFRELLNMMSFATSYINKLPIEFKEKLTWSLDDLPIIGNFLNKVTLGFPIFWRHQYGETQSFYPALGTIPMIMDKSFYHLAATSIYASNSQNNKNVFNNYNLGELGGKVDTVQQGYSKLGLTAPSAQGDLGKIPLDMFTTGGSNALGSLFSQKATSSTLTFTLTDLMTAKYYSSDGNGNPTNDLISSVELGQGLNANDKGAYFVDEQSYSAKNSYYQGGALTDLNGTNDDGTPDNDDFTGKYIITSIGFKGLGDGDAEITAFLNDPDLYPQNFDWKKDIDFQSFIKTSAGYRNSQPREWFTDLEMNYPQTIDIFQNDTNFQWPNDLPDPQPDEVQIKDIQYSITHEARAVTFGYDGNSFSNHHKGQAYFSWDGARHYPNYSGSNYSLDTHSNAEVVDITTFGYSNKAKFLIDYKKLNIGLPDLVASSYFQVGDAEDSLQTAGDHMDSSDQVTIDLSDIVEWDGSSTGVISLDYASAHPLPSTYKYSIYWEAALSGDYGEAWEEDLATDSNGYRKNVENGGWIGYDFPAGWYWFVWWNKSNPNVLMITFWFSGFFHGSTHAGTNQLTAGMCFGIQNNNSTTSPCQGWFNGGGNGIASYDWLNSSYNSSGDSIEINGFSSLLVHENANYPSSAFPINFTFKYFDTDSDGRPN